MFVPVPSLVHGESIAGMIIRGIGEPAGTDPPLCCETPGPMGAIIVGLEGQCRVCKVATSGVVQVLIKGGRCTGKIGISDILIDLPDTGTQFGTGVGV